MNDHTDNVIETPNLSGEAVADSKSIDTLNVIRRQKAQKAVLPLPVLTDAQKDYIAKRWDHDIRTLTQEVFANPALTRRNIECKAVKAHLVSLGHHINAPLPKKEAELVQELTEEQKTYIQANIKESTGPLEMARLIFKNEKLLPINPEYKMVYLYCRQLDPRYRRDEELASQIEYEPPRSIYELVSQVNRYAISPRSDGRALFDSTRLTASDTKILEALLTYMRMPLFKIEANKFIKKIDRDVFESVFISTCWDKSDMPAEHVLQFIQLASLTVKYNQCDRTAQKLDDRLNETLSDPTARLNMTEVETLNAVREKTTVAMKQISALIKGLTGERSKLITERMAGNASMHPLVQAWKNAEDRQRIIQLTERKHKAALKTEIERLSTMDSLKIELFGLGRDDILN